jgi:ATP-dependent Clp protease adaptor protein ClpS
MKTMTADANQTDVTTRQTTRPAIEPGRRTRPIPRYHVVLLDDDDHTYDYVIDMLRKLFGHTAEKAYELACEVDTAGRVIVDTTTKERAELKRDQIHAFGRDWRLDRCRGSMFSLIEPVC